MEKNLRVILTEELNKRKQTRRYYSLRRFAQELGVSPATLSQVMSGKRGLSEKKLAYLNEKLSLNLEKQGLNRFKKNDYIQLPVSAMDVIFNSPSVALLSLAETKNNSASPSEISARLGIPFESAKRAIEQLVQAGLIKIHKGNLKPTYHNVGSKTDIPSKTLRRFHRQTMDLAKRSLKNVELQWRDITSMTLPVSPKSLPEAKKFIEKFRREFCKKFETPDTSEVYTLAVQLFPLTQTFWKNQDA